MHFSFRQTVFFNILEASRQTNAAGRRRGRERISNARNKEELGAQTEPVCPDFFRENAQVIAQNARKNAPA